MAMKIPGADVYTDFSGFNRMRAEARSGSAAGRQAAAKQIEAMFLGMMLKSMRAAGGSMLSGAGAKVREGMFDSQLAQTLAKRSQLGFAELMLNEFNGRQRPSQDSDRPSPGRSGQLPVGRFANALYGRAVAPKSLSLGLPATAASRAAGPAHPAAPPKPALTDPGEAPAKWRNANEFAVNLWPAAERAARALGTQPQAVLAVAALETGWGRHLPTAGNGQGSNNLFGIKAHGWAGPVTQAPTLEFESGRFVHKLEPFRRYASAQQSFEDFVNFIQSRPRYAAALNSGGDPVAFVRALHQAGYATDPQYAGKLEALMRSDTMRKAQHLAAAGPAPSGIG